MFIIDKVKKYILNNKSFADSKILMEKISVTFEVQKY